jgi:hypothetical protein
MFVVHSPSQTLYADYKFEEENKKDFEEFGVYYMNEFLQILQIYEAKDDYIIEQHNDYLKFKSKDSSTIYPLVDLTVVEKYKDKLNEKVLETSKCLLEFTLSEDKISILKKVGSILKSTQLNIAFDKNVKLTLLDQQNVTQTSHTEVIGKEDIINSNVDNKTEFYINFENFSLLKYNYTCKIFENFVLFDANGVGLRYIITVESVEHTNTNKGEEE